MTAVLVDLVDTNVLLRIAEPNSPRHADAVAAARKLGQSRSLVTVPQVAYEFWAVATRTLAANGLGMTPEEADRALKDMTGVFPLLRDERGVFSRWWGLVRDYGMRGVNSYDARLVAAMKRHGLVELLTFNAGDFNRYEGITALTPESILTGVAGDLPE